MDDRCIYLVKLRALQPAPAAIHESRSLIVRCVGAERACQLGREWLKMGGWDLIRVLSVEEIGDVLVEEPTKILPTGDISRKPKLCYCERCGVVFVVDAVVTSESGVNREGEFSGIEHDCRDSDVRSEYKMLDSLKAGLTG